MFFDFSRFLREDSNSSSTWEHRIAKKYYDKLFKEFAITDLSRYKEGKVALRWRTKREVVGGIGQFTCANLKCTHREPYMPSNPAANFVHPSGKKNHQPDLRSWEVNFAYREGGEHKNALVKIRLCPECSYMLNYKKMKEKEQEAVAEREKEAVELKRKRKDKKSKKKRSSAQSDSASDDETKKKKSRNSSKKKRHDGDDDDAADKDSSEESDGGESVQEPSTASTSAPAASLAAQIWGAPQTLETEKSKDEEMDDFFNDIFNQE
ncbi:folate-sensitive fragile site protein Fra10Ac1-domain-containing protein [Obelidium mucronatum]|nr:folate-sensitive fragile site protein Fra10Ac1-domain-containing protein [Obelidium mucronatum]